MVGAVKNTVEAASARQATRGSLVLVGGDRRTNVYGVWCQKKLFSTTISASLQFEKIVSFYVSWPVQRVEGHDALDLEGTVYLKV